MRLLMVSRCAHGNGAGRAWSGDAHNRDGLVVRAQRHIGTNQVSAVGDGTGTRLLGWLLDDFRRECAAECRMEMGVLCEHRADKLGGGAKQVFAVVDHEQDVPVVQELSSVSSNGRPPASSTPNA